VDEERVWNLMQFFGGKAKDGQYHVAKRWAVDYGLGSAHKEVMEDPDVVAAMSKWKDLDVARKQHETGTTRDVAKSVWFPEWDWYMMGEAQDYFRGQTSQDQLVDRLQAKYDELKQMYPE
jgi:multiple sugar transport system substrate-binding protein